MYAVRMPYASMAVTLCRMPYAQSGENEMARTLHDARLDTRNARLRLKQRREPYWRAISGGLAIGYRKGAIGGTWIGRHYSAEEGRRYQSIGTADDSADADGIHVLSFSEAQEAARKWFAHLARHDRGEVRRGPYSVAECLDDYTAWLQDHRKTATDARYRSNAHILPALGEIKCDKLTTAHIQKWLRDLGNSRARLRGKNGDTRQKYRESNGNADAVRQRRSSANRTLTILKAALNRAWRAGKIASDDAWRRVEPFENVDSARARYLTLAECKRLINAADPDFRLIVQAALETGARYGELARLTVADFNADTGTVAIRGSKTGKPRHVVLTDEGQAFFRQVCAGRAGSQLIFTKPGGGAWLKSHQARPMRETCTRARIKPAINFHGLRHTWASLAVMNAVPLLVVAKALGHADTRMVEKHYGHLAPSYIVDAIRSGAPRFGFKPDRKLAALDRRA
jgi:integrase